MTTSPLTADEALRRIELALARTPGNCLLLTQKARCLLGLGHVDQALSVAATARRDDDHDVVTLEALGAFYTIAKRESQALESYDRLLELSPQHPGALFNRAALRRITGDLAGAEADYDAVIRINPHDYEARYNRSDLRVQTHERNHVAELEALLGRTIPEWRGEAQIRYALAKEYEDLGEYEKSWAQLSEGAALRRRNLTYNVERDVQTVDGIRAAFAPRGAAAGEGDPNPAPIFIVGLPRSGTTLVERILSSHSTVTAGGELEHFTTSLLEEIEAPEHRRSLSRQELIEHAARVDVRSLGRRYSQKTRALTGHRPRFTDKLPLNYLYCGLIHRALPRAHIVHVTRHPLAVCYAMYKTLFKQGYPFSYDLNEIGQYYVGYHRLMQHWHAIMPGLIHDLSYEQLIAQQASETRRLLEFCGLTFEEGCLAFDRNPAPTATASASQVRRPIYNTSVSLWTQYADRLAGLRRQLQMAGVPVH
ncbi:MAG: hypothetical protein JWN85_1503 [Gammaproteobacteria bacterium]|nr:hypothetical protein [Gammaproteobacteria bacterium]